MRESLRANLGASPLRTVLQVLLQSRDVQQVRLAHLVADLREALREVDVHILESGEREKDSKKYV